MQTARLMAGVLAAILVAGTGLAAKTNFVSEAGTNFVSPYTSWELATTNLQAAITDTVAADTVLVSNGTYYINSEIAIANAITVKSVWGASSTIVARATSGTNAPQHRIFYITAAATLDGFTARNGCLTNNSGITSQGAGIHMTAGTVQNCVIYSNQLPSLGYGAVGAGVYMNGSGCRLQYCTIVSNSCPVGNTGLGAVYVGSLGGVVHSNTVAFNVLGGGGGGIWLAGGRAEHCIIEYNQTGGSGGGGILMNANGTVSNCVIRFNRSTQGGGGAALEKGTMVDCTISSNSATISGGGIYFNMNYVPIYLRRCLIAGNSNTVSAVEGGGSSGYGSFNFENCLIADNIGTRAIRYPATTAKNWIRFRNCTISGSQPYGFDIAALATNTLSGGTNAYPVFQNTIIYGFTTNLFSTNAAVLADILTNSFTYSCSPQLTAPGFGNVTADPQFEKATAAKYRLLNTSPCANAGTVSVLALYTLDLERVPWGASVNIGCYKKLIPPKGTLFMVR